MNSKVISLGCVGLISIIPCLAQNPELTGEAVMKTNIGAFKINSAGDVKAFGKIRMTFKRGTLLIVGYEGANAITATSGLRVEYQNDKRKRVVYHGEGTVTLDGKFQSIQFFGRNLDMNWSGMGICRLYGEFDKAGETGTYFVKGDKERPWGTGGTYFTLPARNANIVVPKIRPKGSGG